MTVDGRAVEIEPKPLQVLVHLLEHAGKLVTKDALIQAVWPGRIIGDAALTKCIARLREAIGDRDQTLIKTHHRYGYRLIAEVEAQGAAMRIPAAPAVPTPEPLRLVRNTEHRPVTMLFCDLVGSTELADSLDPESFRSVLLDYQQRAAQLARRYEAHVAQQFGDGMLIYFGYPSAHDDDAERAIRYAFDLLHAQRADSRLALALRIGVHSGPLMIGPGPAGEAQATGASLHLASRLQALAEPDSILVSDATFRLVPGLFVTRDFGLQKFRGLNEPVRVHQVLQPSGVRSRLDAQTRLTAFVGREAEIALAERCWREAIEGRGGAILFSGEPGIGKSRLLLELRSGLASRAHTWLECRADALNANSVFHVVAQLLRRGFALDQTNDDAQRLVDLERRLDELQLPPDTAIPLLAPLLNLPATQRYPESSLAPEQQRARLLEWLGDWLARIADDQPLLLVFEDLHWCDESSLEFIGTLFARLASLPLLLVMTARPEFQTDWRDAAPLHYRMLDTLAPGEVELMLADLSGDTAPAAELTARVVERAAGVPLFVEELVRAIQETDALAPAELRGDGVPRSLDSLLRARLDRLGAARELIQTAAVIGMECESALLQRVSGLDDATLDTLLVRLIDSGLLLARGTSPGKHYVFKHALIRDSAYGALTRSTRQSLHARTADAVEILYAARLEDHSAALAHHCEQAGQAERAAAYAQQAGARALRLSANAQAVLHLGNAVRLLETLPATPQRLQEMAGLQSTLGATLVALRGYADPQVAATYAKAREWCLAAGGGAPLGPILLGMSAYALVGGDIPAGLGFARELVEATGETDADAAHSAAHYILGQAFEYGGQFDAALESFGRAIACYERGDCRDMALLYQEDAKGGALGLGAWALWFTGRPEQARTLAQRAVDHVAQIEHAYSRAGARALSAHAQHLRRDVDATRTLATECVELCREHGFAWLEGLATLHLGWVAMQEGRAAEGIELIRAALEALSVGGARYFLPYAHLLLCESLAATGQYADAQSAIDEALAIATTTGEHMHLAEVHRIRGVLRLVGDAGARDVAQAEACFRTAIAVAAGQQAKSWELRAATSLASLWREQGRTREAVEMLKSVYAGFTEGFDTPDLRDAAVLLAALDRGH